MQDLLQIEFNDDLLGCHLTYLVPKNPGEDVEVWTNSLQSNGPEW